MYRYYNPNPSKIHVGDCVIRALTVAIDGTWDEAFMALMVKEYQFKDMPSSNAVWGSLLTDMGYDRYMMADFISVREFAEHNQKGTYILATGTHVLALVNGEYLDTWDSGDEIPIYFFTKEE